VVRATTAARRLTSQRSCRPEGSVLSFKGTPAKGQLLISIVVIFVVIAVAYFALVSPR